MSSEHSPHVNVCDWHGLVKEFTVHGRPLTWIYRGAFSGIPACCVLHFINHFGKKGMKNDGTELVSTAYNQCSACQRVHHNYSLRNCGGLRMSMRNGHDLHFSHCSGDDEINAYLTELYGRELVVESIYSKAGLESAAELLDLMFTVPAKINSRDIFKHDITEKYTTVEKRDGIFYTENFYPYNTSK